VVHRDPERDAGPQGLAQPGEMGSQNRLEARSDCEINRKAEEE
jgi:hypothetical protein